MRAIVADDAKSTRIRLSAALEVLGYKVEAFSNGEEAFERLLSDDPPPIAFLDWEMPGHLGPEVCRRLHEKFDYVDTTRVRPYLVMMTARSSPASISEALDAGADDYLTKPWDAKELGARIRVAERTLEYQSELKKKIKELEEVLRRNNLLREAIVNRTDGASAEEIAGDAPIKNVNFSDRIASLSGLADLNATMAKTFSQMGIGEAAASSPKNLGSSKNQRYLAWAPMLLKESETWLDLRCEMSRESAEELYLALLKQKPTSDEEIGDALVELLNMVQGALKPILSDNNVTVVSPLIPVDLSRFNQRIPPIVSENHQKSEVSIGQIKMLVTVVESSRGITNRDVMLLEKYDVLVESFVSPKNKNVVILKEGSVINEFYAHKLKSFSAPTGDSSVTVNVMIPSAIGLEYMKLNDQT
ncbi:MAG: response regulator [Deltaproteobacteria bacterium]|nr:response regulator [Deltaproteobacteria bacterium]